VIIPFAPKRNRLLPILVILFFIIFPLSQVIAQYNPASGSDDLRDLFSPSQRVNHLGLGTRPSARRINPSLLAEVRAGVLEAGYIGLFNIDSQRIGNLWSGHGLTGTFLLPLPVGSLGFGFDLSNGLSDGAEIGTFTNFSATWARELEKNFQIGLGLNTQFGSYSSNIDWGLNIDLGISQLIDRPEQSIETLFWGTSITGLGKSYSIDPDQSGLLSFATLHIHGGFHTRFSDAIGISPALGLSLPSFQNFRINAGIEIDVFQTVFLNIHSQLDLKQVLDSQLAQRSLIPTIGLTVALPIRDGRNHRSILEDSRQFHLSASPWYDSTWGFGLGVQIPLIQRDIEGPIIIHDFSDRRYISPNNDGTNDRLDINFRVTDDSPIRTLGFQIIDPLTGNLVFEQFRVPQEQNLTGIKNITNRLFASPPEVPGAFIGSFAGRSSDGLMLPDGEFQLVLKGMDIEGNISQIYPALVIIDTVPPQISIEQPSPEDRIFSPNDDGNKDTFIIKMEGSIEPIWQGGIRNASGDLVRTIQFNGESPRDFEWDGLNDRGEKAPDGVYEFIIRGEDYAGNKTVAELTNIILNTFVDPVRIQISQRAFSPNGNGVQDTITFFPELTRTQGVNRWEIQIIDTNNQVLRTLSGNGTPPAQVLFDGRTSPNDELLPEEIYRGELSVFYQNGNIPRSITPEFILDITPPEALAFLNLDSNIVSPGVTGENQVLSIFQEASTQEDQWIGIIQNSRGEEVYRRTWNQLPDSVFQWDGLQSDSSPAPDGDYRYILKAQDLAGNSFETPPVRFVLDTSQAEFLVTLNHRAFSPNADGIRDTLEIRLQQQNPVAIERYEIQIRNQQNQIIRRFSGGQTLSQQRIWDGRNDSGLPVVDGLYSVFFQAFQVNGNVFSTTVGPVLLDVTFPRLEARVSETIFSPNGDGNRDTITLLAQSSEEDLIMAEVLDSTGRAVFSREFRGRATNIVWDGRNQIGNLVTDGVYRFRLRATDQAGNAAQSLSDPFTLDTRVANAFITLSARGLAPTGNGLFDTITFGLFLNLLEGLETWNLEIQNDQNQVIRRFTGTQAQESFNIQWDGRNANGQIVPGRYRAVFSARYTKGDAPVAESPSFLLDTTGPDIRMTVQPQPFSPDGDGIDDEVLFRPIVQDPSGIAGWSLQIFDRTGKLFQEFSGQGQVPQQIVWDGLALTGEKVIAAEDYPYRFSAIDSLGNTNTVQGVVETDIFVIRDGDRLYVQIANITFEPNSPVLSVSPDTAVGIRNNLILNRLVDIFSRFPTYRIRIEGHAVNVTGTENEQIRELIPLSTRRAQSVKDALVSRGMDPNRITILGVGGAQPIVPHTDLENRWKNRRVEFILDR
jgi:outer membrane protein OmpA-like peptidoglycan-associated protein/flagellar hook assembly protein FlgD